MSPRDGKIRGISVPSVPWHEESDKERRRREIFESREAFLRGERPIATVTYDLSALERLKPAPKPQGKP